ncbi:hypothetical protein ACROYT_G024802 [Oculina patagonica]
MTLNPEKCKALVLSSNNRAHISLYADGEIIPRVYEVELLGVVIDDALNFSTHVSKIIKKAGKQLDVICRLRNVLSSSSKLCLYNSFVMSYFTYCSSIWHNCLKSDSDKLEKLHERALRYIYKGRSSSSASLCSRIGYTLSERRIQDTLIIIFKCLNNLAPVYLKDLFCVRDNIKNLRGINKIVLPKVNTTKYGLKSVRYWAANAWNQLPDRVHVSASSDVADHCRVYALNDPKDRDYQSQCSHEHNTSCDNCDDLTKTMDEMEAAIEKLASSDVKEELCFVMRKARKDIVNWKAHLLRSVNQEEARLSQLDALDSTSIVSVQDWAMKFLPRKFRESQTDWSCNQDGCTVLSVMSDVLRQVKEAQPQVKKTYYWQDNLGCYHCGTTIVGAKLISQQHEVSIERLDFCDSQAGKGACDRKAAGIKSHMKIYLNSGNNIESAEEMKDAILSAGGLPSVNVTVSGPPEPETFSAIMLEGVSAISNIEYTDEGLIVWRAYKIGPGKLIQWDNLDFQPNTEVPGLSAVDSVTNGQKANFTTIQSKKPKIPSKQADTPAPSDSPSSDESSSDESNVSLFSCPEEGCIKRYQRFSSLQRHLDCGKHHRAIENESLLDRAITGYSERLEVQSGIVPNIPTEVPKPRPTGSVSLPMGWALRSSQVKRTRFNTSQRDYLTKKFDLGETSGRKEDPDSVARAMMTARDSEGNRLFTSAEFLTSKQIASFFSRLAAKRRRQDVADVSDEEVDNAERESALQELTNTVMQEVSLEHPIVYDCYNLCELVRSSKLSSFVIQMLKEICNHFEIDTSHIKVKRKKQYVDLLVSFSKNCSCQK